MKKSLPLTIAAAITITTQAQNVGIGEANPANKLSVKGNLSIGSGYSTTAAPADGAIIEGRVGIGTSSPSYPLTVERNLGVGSGQQILAGFTRLTSGAANGGLLLGYEGDGVSVVRSFIYAAGNQRDLVFQNFDGGLQNRMVISGTGQVGIGTITPDSKSILDVQSTTRGVFLARMTTAQRNAISGLGTSHTGLTIYNTDNNRYEFWDGDSWEPVGIGAGGPPTGPAGGDLTGTYPNPSIANNAVNSAKILDGSITGDDLATGAVDLAGTKVTGVLPVPRGGTGQSSLGVNRVLYGNGTSPVETTNAPTSAQVLIANAGGVPTFTTFTGDVTNNASGVTLISNDAVTSAKIADGAIVNADISNTAAIARSKIAAGTANHVVINDGSGNLSSTATLPASNIPNLAGDVTGSITSNVIANDAVTSAKILDGTITGADLADNAVDLTGTKVTGILPISRGGTNSTATPTAGAVAYGTGTAYAFTPAGTAGDLLLSNGSSAPSWSSPNGLFWRVNGNSGRTPSSSNIGTAVNNNFLGTTDANDLVFARNNLEAFRIRDVGGNQIVSFNSGAGGYTIGAIGSLNTVMTIGGAQNTNGVSNPVVLIMDRDVNNDAPNNVLSGIAFGEPGSANRAGQTRIEGRRSALANSSGATDLPTDLVFYTTPDGSATARDWMRLSHDGALVLGENDNQTGWGPGRIRGTIATGTDGAGQNLTIDAGNGTGSGGSGNIIFRTAPPGASGSSLNTMTERVRITNQGRVGIGTTNPNTLVDVVGGASGTETRIMTLRSNFTANNTGTSIALINSTSATSNVGAELAAITTDAANGASQLIFRTHGGGGSFGALQERMRLTNQGRLGIGTNDPLDLLHVDNSASGASSARIGRTATQFDNRLFFGDGSLVYVGEQVADDRLYLRGGTMTIDIGGNTGGANGRVLTSNGTTVSWQPPVPIGAIIAWVNHLTGTPSLPPGWVECNGGTISDPESPLNGQPIPNLNGTFTHGGGGTSAAGRFLRGTTGTTGSTASDQANNLAEVNMADVGTPNSLSVTVPDNGSWSGWVTDYYLTTSNDAIRFRKHGRETYPGYYTVRWIMRIK